MADARKSPILVVLGIIHKDQEILISQRLASSAVEGGKWEFPGGKVEPFEHPPDALKREIREELGMEIEVGPLFDVNSHIYENRVHVVLLGYECRWVKGDIRLLEVADAKWINPAELGAYDFALADLPFVARLSTPRS